MKQLSPMIIILIILVGAVTSCRSNNDSTNTTAITITMAGFPSAQQQYETLAQQFREQYSHIAVQYVVLDQQSGSLALSEQVALADVLLLQGWLPNNAATLLQDLSPLANADPTFNEGDFWPGLWEACQVGSVQVGMPLSVNVDLIFYDKAAFDAIGLPYPAPGWDWLTFQQLAQQLTSPTTAGMTRYGFVDSGRPLTLLGPLVDSFFITNTVLETGPLVSQLEWYVNFVQEGVIPALHDNPQTAVTRRNDLIRGGQAAMWLGSQFELGQWQELFGDNLGVQSFPTSNTVASTPARPTCAVISGGSTQLQAAWMWLQFLSTQPAVGLQSDIPARPTVAQSSGYWAGMTDTVSDVLNTALAHGWYGSGVVGELTAVSDALLEAITNETSLANNLPTTIEVQPTTPPPTPDSTPVAVATAHITPTPAALPNSSLAVDEVIIVDYHAGIGQGNNHTALVALAHAFNEAQDSIEVRLNTTFRGSYITDMADSYDCFAWGGSASSYGASFPEFTNKVYSLTPLLAAEETAFAADFPIAQLDWSTFEGEVYALPVAVQPLVIQYNADIFASAGLKPPSLTWTVDEFWQLATAVTRNETGSRVYGFVPSILMPENLPLLFPQEAYPFGLDSSPPEATFTDPAIIQGLTWLATMVEEGVMFPIDWGGTQTTLNPDYASLQMQRQAGLIVSGQAAMWVAQGGAASYQHLTTGIVPFPQTDLAALPSMTPALTALYISQRATNPLGCWEWLKFLSAQPTAFFGIPVRHSVMESSGWVTTVGAETAAAYREALSQPIQPTPDSTSVIYPYYLWWSDALQETFAGAPSADVLVEMQRQADIYLTCITAALTSNWEQIVACARQADPDFPIL